MTINIDPVTMLITAAIFVWVFRVDRNLVKLNTMIHACKTCRKAFGEMSGDTDDNSEK